MPRWILGCYALGNVPWGLGNRAQGESGFWFCACANLAAVCTVGMMAGVMSSRWLEFRLVCRVGAAIGPVGIRLMAGKSMGAAVGTATGGDVATVVEVMASVK